MLIITYERSTNTRNLQIFKKVLQILTHSACLTNKYMEECCQTLSSIEAPLWFLASILETHPQYIHIMLYSGSTIHERYLRAIRIKIIVCMEVLMNSAPIGVIQLINSMNWIL
jgi:glycosyltransferase A (GT-A) superfamily protein (DUF2064 family)